VASELGPDERDRTSEPRPGSRALVVGWVRARRTVVGRVAVIGVAAVVVLGAASWFAPRSLTPAPSHGSTPLVVDLPQRSYAATSSSDGRSPAASPSPLGPNEPWGGLAWSGRVAADLPWGHVPAQLIGWNGRYVGLDFAGPDNTGEVVVASSTDLAKWTVLARGAGGPFPHGLSGGSVALVAGPAGLVAIGPYGVCVSPCTAEVWTSADGAT
jgi:hypothetical protein